MILEEIKLQRLAGQHLLVPAYTQTVVKTFAVFRRRLSAMHSMPYPFGAPKTTQMTWSNAGRTGVLCTCSPWMFIPYSSMKAGRIFSYLRIS